MATADKTEIMDRQEFRVGRDCLGQMDPDQTTGAAENERANRTNSQLLASLSEAVGLLQPAQEEIERLHAQLLQAREAYQMLAIDLAAAEMREAETRAGLDQTCVGRAEVQRQALREEILRQEKRRQRAWWRLGRQ